MSNDHTGAERVRLAIESRQDGEVTVLYADGQLYRKGSSFYLLYKESASDTERPVGSGAAGHAGEIRWRPPSPSRRASTAVS